MGVEDKINDEFIKDLEPEKSITPYSLYAIAGRDRDTKVRYMAVGISKSDVNAKKNGITLIKARVRRYPPNEYFSYSHDISNLLSVQKLKTIFTDGFDYTVSKLTDYNISKLKIPPDKVIRQKEVHILC